ncbi:hypothetical protein [Cysteiniphilum halobium]|uniref:hypothetical protein n=1 Tax=Cysteiniphilum halobium TaxID=2219059 RepID=UPI000E65E74F|nr:hypothetical protein [Cysteiniphilum halobium]
MSFDLLIESVKYDYQDFQSYAHRMLGSDWGDVGALLHYLRALKKYDIVDMDYSDFSEDEIYHDSKPNWVASVLSKWDVCQ